MGGGGVNANLEKVYIKNFYFFCTLPLFTFWKDEKSAKAWLAGENEVPENKMTVDNTVVDKYRLAVCPKNPKRKNYISALSGIKKNKRYIIRNKHRKENYSW